MNGGGNPDRDDFGLPRVDVQIPDDARELDRDVQAYHRELRALRRRMLLRRLAAPLTRHGLVMPLIAASLALTLLAGTLLTVFTAGQAAWVPGPAPQRIGPPPARQAPQPGRLNQPLPDATVQMDGTDQPLTSLAPAALGIVPPRCGCLTALRQLAARTASAQVPLYLVGVQGAQVASLAARIGLPLTRAAEDTSNVLADYARPAGLTAVLVRADGRVAAIIGARAGRLQLGTRLRALSGGRQG